MITLREKQSVHHLPPNFLFFCRDRFMLKLLDLSRNKMLKINKKQKN